MTQVKISSTRLDRFLSCERRARFAHDLEDEAPSRAMCYGTVFHACVEFYAERGRWPSRGDLWRMTGNYSDPRDAVRAYPDIWPDVQRYFEFEPVEALAREHYEARRTRGLLVEKPLADFGLTIAGGAVEVTGFFDVLDEENRTIEDWKTRGNMRYAPISAEDFHDNVQLAYYAAALAQVHPDWPDVTVKHRNIQRPKTPKDPLALVTYEATIDRWFLDRVWEHLDTVIGPAYLRALTETNQGLLDANPAACYGYGKICPFADACAALDNPLGDGLASTPTGNILDLEF